MSAGESQFLKSRTKLAYRPKSRMQENRNFGSKAETPQFKVSSPHLLI
jgi:hypothetical protein